jgi:hypothetical protein
MHTELRDASLKLYIRCLIEYLEVTLRNATACC